MDVQIISDKVENDLIHQLKASGATDIAVSPNGKEVAFIVRGDVYVTSVDYETTKQITNTPQQERDLDFSPDGRSLVYSAERGETWGVYQSEPGTQERQIFHIRTGIERRTVGKLNSQTSFQPMYSPDGKGSRFLGKPLRLYA